MLARSWDLDERQSLVKEKEEIQNGQVLELPALPSEWAAKYEEIYGSKPPDGVAAPPVVKVEAGEEEEVKPDVSSDEIKQETEVSSVDSKAEIAVLSLKRPLEHDDEVTIKEQDLDEQVQHYSFFVNFL